MKNSLPHINRRIKIYDLCVDTEKLFDKTQQPFGIETLKRKWVLRDCKSI